MIALDSLSWCLPLSRSLAIFLCPSLFLPWRATKGCLWLRQSKKVYTNNSIFFEIENKGFTQGKGSWGFLPHRGKFSVITILKCHYPQYLLQWLISDILWETKTMTQWYFKWRQRRFVKTAVTCNWNFCFFQHLFIICARYVMRTRHVTSRETF